MIIIKMESDSSGMNGLFVLYSVYGDALHLDNEWIIVWKMENQTSCLEQWRNEYISGNHLENGICGERERDIWESQNPYMCRCCCFDAFRFGFFWMTVFSRALYTFRQQAHAEMSYGNDILIYHLQNKLTRLWDTNPWCHYVIDGIHIACVRYVLFQWKHFSHLHIHLPEFHHT